MKNKVHLVAGATATLCIAIFFISTIIVDFFGSPEIIATVKSLIVMPGLFILIPSIATTGGTGFALSKFRTGHLIDKKKKRMQFVGANGILILIPCALILNQWASIGSFDTKFYLVQIVELVAGAVNLTLMGFNIQDGLIMTGKLTNRVTAK